MQAGRAIRVELLQNVRIKFSDASDGESGGGDVVGWGG